jgi:hypothetical protein
MTGMSIQELMAEGMSREAADLEMHRRVFGEKLDLGRLPT